LRLPGICKKPGRCVAAADLLRALWAFQSGWQQSALGVGFIALSNHRKSLQPLLAEVTNAARQAQGLTPMLEDAGVDAALLPSVALATILVAIARTLANEERMGITIGHAEGRAFIALALDRLGAGGSDGLN
jgi:TetR/AcrR family transcriptional regulator of autoinduction and epiphytic fitness